MGREEDDLVAQVALEHGMVTPEQLEEASEAQRKAAEAAGLEVDLVDVLTKKNLIDNDQREQILQQVGIMTGEARAVGGYEALAKLGQGAMGAVYKARKMDTGELVALKILPPSLANEKMVARFKRESDIVRKLDHESIVRCVEFGYDEKRRCWFCALELVEGEDVLKRIGRLGRFEEGEAVSIARQLAGALEHAYQNGLVHRDVKPENIMVTRDGRAKLLDLGLARRSDAEATRYTQEGLFIGSPHYASPEQATGASDIDIRADIYGLGATLFHMVTGSTPYKGSTVMEVLQKQVGEKVPWPADLNRALSDGICRVITKMLAKRPEDRYAAPDEVVKDLEEVAAGRAPAVTDAALARAARPLGKPAARARGPRHASARARPAGARSRGGGAKLAAGIVAAAAVAVIAGVVLLAGEGAEEAPAAPQGSPPPVVTRAPARETPSGAPLPGSSKEAAGGTTAAARAMRETRAFELDHAEEPGAAIERYEAVEREFPGTVGAAEAKAAGARLKAGLRRADEGRATAPLQPGEWLAIFDGRDMSGWKGIGDGARIEGGHLVSAGSSDLFYGADWDRFDLELEVRGNEGLEILLCADDDRSRASRHRVRLRLHPDGDMHVLTGERVYRSGRGRFPLSDWLRLRLRLTDEELCVYKGDRLEWTVEVSRVPPVRGGVYLFAAGSERATARVRRARVRGLAAESGRPRVASRPEVPAAAPGPGAAEGPPPAGQEAVPGATATDEARLEDFFEEFDASLERGEYAEAKRRAARARVELADHAGLADAAASLAASLGARRDGIRKAAKALMGAEARLDTRKGPLKGTVAEVGEEGITLSVQIRAGRNVLGVSKQLVPWADLLPDQESRLAAAGGWNPAGGERAIALAVMALRRKDAAGAEEALEAAAGHPLEPHYRRRVNARRIGEAEAATLAAWQAIERQPLDERMSPVEAKRLLARIAEFERGHGGTKVAADAAPKIPGLRKAAQWIAAGRPTNYALSFAGTRGHARIADSDEFDVARDVTVEAWVKPAESDFVRGSNEHGIVCHERWSTRGEGGYYLMILSYTGGQEPMLGFRLNPADNEHQMGAGRIAGIVRAGEWSHVAGTYDGAAIRVFANGKLIGSAACTFDMAPSSLHVTIGSRDGGSHDFGGVIDEVRISKACRYTRDFAPPAGPFAADENTIALWHLDDKEGAVVSDATGRHDGALAGAPHPAWTEGCPKAGMGPAGGARPRPEGAPKPAAAGPAKTGEPGEEEAGPVVRKGRPNYTRFVEARILRGHDAPIVTVGLNATGSRVISAASDVTFKVWDTASGRELASFKGEYRPGIVMSSDRTHFTYRGSFYEWPVRDATSGRVVGGAKWENARLAALNSTGAFLFVAKEFAVKAVRVRSRRETTTFSGHTGHLGRIAVSRNDRVLATAAEDGTVRVWNVATGQQVSELEGQFPRRNGLILALAPDGSRVLTRAGNESDSTMWDAATGRAIVTLKGHGGPATSVDFSPDGRFVATASRDGKARVWLSATGRKLTTLRGHEGPANHVEFGPDGQWMITASDDDTAIVWHLKSGRPARTLQGHTAEVKHATFSRDGRVVATASHDGSVRVWVEAP